jgi:hypothetical protein
LFRQIWRKKRCCIWEQGACFIEKQNNIENQKNVITPLSPPHRTSPTPTRPPPPTSGRNLRIIARVGYIYLSIYLSIYIILSYRILLYLILSYLIIYCFIFAQRSHYSMFK